jgi:Ca-activated chloride channel homolog
MRSSSRIFVLALFLLLPALVTFASFSHQQSLPATDAPLRVLSVTVRNKTGDYVMGVPREAFELTDENEKRSIEFFENSDSPASIGILVDTSESMRFFDLKEVARPKPILEAISQLVDRGHADNEYFLVAFDRTPRFLTDWLNGPALLAQKIAVDQAKSQTAMYDACFEAVQKLGTAHHSRKVLILISDGIDNTSRHSFKELQRLLGHSEVTLYAIGVYASGDVSSLGVESRNILAELAGVTGGEVFFVDNRKKWNEAIDQLGTELHHQYRIGFRPANNPPNKWHRIKLKVTPPSNAPAEFSKLTIRAGRGYYTQ